jgi:small nuclear ribonucleoprotein (snRNP)-like protein
MVGYSGIRLRPSTKDALDYLRGKDYTIDEVINILLDNFIETDEDEDDEDQTSLFDYDEDEE